MDLFGRSLPIEWLPGETLYSLISRMHRLAGSVRSADTSNLFFGSGRAGGTPTMTTSINALVDRTQGALGTAEELVFVRQTVGYFVNFLPYTEREMVLSVLRDNAAASSIRAAIGNRQPSHLLRWCPECRSSDRTKFGVAYWRVNHQLPCTWSCIEHQCLLQEVQLEKNASWLSRWKLPDEFPAGREEKVGQSVDAAAAYAADIQVRGKPVELSDLLTEWIQTTVAEGREFDQTHDLNTLTASSQKQIQRALQRSQGRLVVDGNNLPLLMVLCHRNFDYPRTFDQWAQQCPKFIEHRVLRRQVVQMVRAGTTITKAASIVGVDTETAHGWAGKKNFTLARRYKKLGSKEMKTALALLRQGADSKLAAKAVGVMPSTINKLLKNEPSLHHEWKQKLEDFELQRARKRVMGLVNINEKISGQAIRNLEPDACSFLLSKDPLWLLEISATGPSQATAEDRCDRDREISERLDSIQLVPTSSEPMHVADLLDVISFITSEVDYLLSMPRTLNSLRRLTQMTSTQIEMF